MVAPIPGLVEFGGISWKRRVFPGNGGVSLPVPPNADCGRTSGDGRGRRWRRNPAGVRGRRIGGGAVAFGSPLNRTEEPVSMGGKRSESGRPPLFLAGWQCYS